MEQAYLPDRALHLCEIAKSLETAANALRQAVGQGVDSLEQSSDESASSFSEGCSLLGGKPNAYSCGDTWTDTSIHESMQESSHPSGCTSTSSALQNLLSNLPRRLEATATALHARNEVHGPGSLRKATLSRENELLRGALGDAARRLAELEGEKERFLSEDVFDLVNSLCRSELPDDSVLDSTLDEGQ